MESANNNDIELRLNSEYEQFLRDLEENPDLRFNLSLYRNKEYQPSEMASVTDGEDLPSVSLDELLADLDLSDAEDNNGWSASASKESGTEYVNMYQFCNGYCQEIYLHVEKNKP